jgi:2-polyprenyl-3-methyl-5-hydroxy-6-metoxy-1,4-benzoquinol methylase
MIHLINPDYNMAELTVGAFDGKRGRKLLDVGCGNGQFLAKMRDLGWEVIGVEPDIMAVRVARESFGLNVHEGMINGADFPSDTFDAITMNHVIEHVLDPIGLFRECHRVLKSGGKLVVNTPNIESFGAHHFGNIWVHWDPPRHIHLFSLQALNTCVERTGLKALKLRTTSNHARWVWQTSRLNYRNGTLLNGSSESSGLLLRLEGLAFLVMEDVLYVREQAGEELVLVATK